MKMCKKIFSLLLVVAMMLSLGITAFAANDGSITVRNATVDETYTVYKVFDLTYSGSNVSYSYTKTGETDAVYTALIAENSPFTLTATSTAGVYNVTLKDGQTSADIATFLKDNVVGKLTAVGTKTATSDTVQFTNLGYGYYYVTSSLGSVVTIDSTMKNVTIVDKNQGPSWDNETPDPDDPDNPDRPGKVIVNADGSKTTVNSANYGDTVHFSIAVNATAYVGKDLATYYYITDTLANGFNPAINIKVFVGGNQLAADAYTLTQNGNTFQVNIPFGEIYGSNAKIEVTYDAVVNTDAVIAGNGNLNTAKFDYVTDPNFDPDVPGYDPGDPDVPGYPDDPYDPEDPDNPNPPFNKFDEVTTKTYVYAVAIQKIDKDGNALTGAKFTVADADGNPIKAASGSNGVYTYSSTGTITEYEVGSNGMLVIKGLEAGTYTVTETQAPEGYNLLTESFNVTAELEAEYTTTMTVYLKDGAVVNTAEGATTKTYTAPVPVAGKPVINNTGTELPSTGGIGTKLFYCAGAVLMVGAATILIAKKKMIAE